MKKNKKRINTSKVVIIFSLILIVVIVLYTSLNSDEELKYNISRLAMILADLQNKKQKGGEIDLSTGKYALYRP